MFSGFASGLSAYIKALKFLFKPRILGYLFVSGLISLIVFSIFFYSIYAYGPNLSNYFKEILLSYLNYPIISQIIDWLSRIALWLGFILIFKYIILIINAPIMSFVSSHIEQRIGSIETIKLDQNFIQQLARGLRLSLSNLGRELLLTLGLLIISLFPGMAFFTTPAIFIVQAYYAGFGNLDYFLERHLDRRGTRQFVKRNKGLAVGIGSIFLLMLFIPLLGVFFAPVWSTVAATIAGRKVLTA